MAAVVQRTTYRWNIEQGKKSPRTAAFRFWLQTLEGIHEFIASCLFDRAIALGGESKIGVL